MSFTQEGGEDLTRDWLKPGARRCILRIKLARSILPELEIHHKVYQILIKPCQVQKPGGEAGTEKQLESEFAHQRDRDRDAEIELEMIELEIKI